MRRKLPSEALGRKLKTLKVEGRVLEWMRSTSKPQTFDQIRVRFPVRTRDILKNLYRWNWITFDKRTSTFLLRVDMS